MEENSVNCLHKNSKKITVKLWYYEPLLWFAFFFTLLKTKNNFKNALFALIIVRIEQNNKKFGKDYCHTVVLRGFVIVYILFYFVKN